MPTCKICGCEYISARSGHNGRVVRIEPFPDDSGTALLIPLVNGLPVALEARVCSDFYALVKAGIPKHHYHYKF